MRERIIRIALILIAVSSVVAGVWAQFAPRSFYTSFPGGGRHWISADGPFNEHLVRDFGGLNLALAVVAIAAAIALTRPLVIAAAVATLVYYVPHLVYHANHLDVYDTSDKVANVVSLSLAVVLPVVVLVLEAGRGRPASSAESSSSSSAGMVPTQQA